jgi:hypothetical protein
MSYSHGDDRAIGERRTNLKEGEGVEIYHSGGEDPPDAEKG